jgi:CubicO group peptidase (beta-lactamase class C family)
MVAHLHVPAIDAKPNLSTTLSPKAVTTLLREEVGFEGLVFTDALEMKGVTKHFKPGEVAVLAFKAGNDMLVLPDNMDAAFAALKKAFQKGDLSPDELDVRVRRILMAKYALGLEKRPLPDPAEAAKAAFDPNAVALKHKLIEQALTVAQNKMALIPLINLSDYSYATLALGSPTLTTFQKRIESYVDAVHFNAGHNLTADESETLLHGLKPYKRVIVSLHFMTNKVAQQFGLTREELLLIQNLQRDHDVILVIFGSPYSLKLFENIDHIIAAYEDNPETEDLAAQGLMGVFGLNGRLPVTASNIFPVHHGYTTPSLKRLGFTVPERVGMVGDSLAAIRTIAEFMIKIKAAPGCEVLIAREGRIVFHESFGTHTYEDTKDSVRLTDLYDLASITKVAATTAAMMRLQAEDRVDIDKTLGDYLPWLAGSNKAPMVIRDVMAHHAGLKSYIEFFKKTVTLENDYWLTMEPGLYSDEPSPQFCLPVAENMYMDARWLDTIRRQIIESPLNAHGTYVYSDLGFIMLSEIIHRQSGAPIEDYVDSVFYRPMSLGRILYNPLRRFPTEEIAPTEVDNYFRCQPLKGHVHDMASAMFGGVSGHAGLFSDAFDLASLFQMMLNNGTYGGRRYLDSLLIKEWTTRWGHSTRRGIGFDMKELNPDKTQLMSRLASAGTFGHTGFTGNCVWADPATGLLYVFLSNRTYPKMDNPKLRDNGIREKIHTRAYKAIRGYAEPAAIFLPG